MKAGRARRPVSPRARPSATPARAPHSSGTSRGSGTPPWVEIAIVLACIALAFWAQRRALGGFFSLDDLVIIEEARGLREATPGPWRLFSRYLYFGAAVPLFGSNPFPYHLVSVLLHGANVALLYLFVRRRAGSPLAAAVAAGLFGASRLHVTAMGSAATIGEPLALGFTLGALMLHDGGRFGRVAAPVLFLCALLSKESVVLLPALLLLPRPGEPLRARVVKAVPLLAVGALFAVVLLLTGAGATHLAGEAYARGYGANLFLNLMTYSKWVVDLADPFPGQVSAIAGQAWPAGLAACAGLALLAVVARRVPLPPAFGAAWWLLALIPVLPLLHHSYLYYLYVPLAGIVMALAGAVGRVERARVHPAIVRALAVALVLAHALHADRLLAERHAARIAGTGIPLDPDLRKSEVARQASLAVGKALAGREARVAFLVPAGLEEVFSATTGERQRTASDSGSYTMLGGALDDGRGLRALHPNVDSVAFLRGWTPGYGGFEMFSQSRDGAVHALGRGADGYAAAGASMLAGGAVEPGRRLLEGALSEFPDHAPLRFQVARGLHLGGDSLGMVRELDELVRRTPDHPLAARVRQGRAASRQGSLGGTRAGK